MTALSEVLREFVLDAGKLAREMQAGATIAVDKGQNDFATNGDLAAQERLIALLEREFPGVPIVAEEQSNSAAVPAECFVIDPIDGTYNYSMGIENWAVMVGLVRNGKPEAGAIAMPALGDVYWCERGKGAFLNGRTIALRSLKPGEMLFIATDLWHGLAEPLSKSFVPLLRECRSVRAIGTAGGCFMDLFRGRLHAYLNLGAKIWDYAAGFPGVVEAGGVGLDVSGSEMVWNSLALRGVFGSPDAVAKILPYSRQAADTPLLKV